MTQKSPGKRLSVLECQEAKDSSVLFSATIRIFWKYYKKQRNRLCRIEKQVVQKQHLVPCFEIVMFVVSVVKFQSFDSECCDSRAHLVLICVISFAVVMWSLLCVLCVHSRYLQVCARLIFLPLSSPCLFSISLSHPMSVSSPSLSELSLLCQLVSYTQ